MHNVSMIDNDPRSGGSGLLQADDCGPAAGRVRGRPREFDRTSALEKATRLFWSKGYEATSITDLTKAIGIGSPSLYAAFSSKEALYTEALRHYADTWGHLVWGGFEVARTAREAVLVLLLDSASALTGQSADIPLGCMMTLSAVGSEGHVQLGETVRSGRAVTFNRLRERFGRAIADMEIPPSVDIDALARFVQVIQNGMSILARDGALREELEKVAEIAMSGWDARVICSATKKAVIVTTTAEIAVDSADGS